MRLKKKALYLICFLDHASGTEKAMYFKAVGWFIKVTEKRGKKAYVFTTWKASAEDSESFDNNLELFTLCSDIILKITKLRDT